MSEKNRFWKTLLAVAVIATLLLGGISAAQAQDGPPPMFGDAGNVPAVDGARAAQIARERLVFVNVNSLFNSNGKQLNKTSLPAVTLNLFPDVNYTGQVDRAWADEWGSYWSGSLKDVQGGYFYLTVVDGVFMAHVASPLGVYEVSLVNGDLYKTVQIDQTKFKDHDESWTYDAPSEVLPAGSLGPTADTGAIIDIMVVYSDDARAAAGGTPAMKATILTALNETNTGYANSGITTRLRLVHVEEYSYTETGDLPTDLSRLVGASDAYFKTVHTLRNTYGADMVGLIVENGGPYCGLANAIMANANNAFQVTARSCATGYYSFGHEFGHLQGARHDVYVDSSTSPYSYGHGYVHRGSTTATRWRTIMAYNNYCSVAGYDCTRLQYWSNPTKTYGGAALGNTKAQNYKVLRDTDYTVANFRTTRIGSDFNSSFNGASSGWSAVKGVWAIGSGMYFQSDGVANQYSSASHSGLYGDLTYQVRMKRDGGASLPNYIVIRGAASPLGADGQWNKEYRFAYNNGGKYSIWEVTGNVPTARKNWTSSAAIVPNNWNSLKLIAVGSTMKFYINGTLVYTFTDTSYTTGAVGFGFSRDASVGTMYVDWATLSTTATADEAP